MINFNCAACGKAFSIHDDLAGREGMCACGASIKVPAVGAGGAGMTPGPRPVEIRPHVVSNAGTVSSESSGAAKGIAAVSQSDSASQTGQSPVSGRRKFCIRCGAKNEKQTRFCTACGASLVVGVEAERQSVPVAQPAQHQPMPPHAEPMRQSEKNAKANSEDSRHGFPVGNSGPTCDVCHKGVPESALTRQGLDLCSIVGVGFAKESRRSSVLAGNYCIGCVFKPLRKFAVQMAYCGDCRRTWEEELKKNAAAKRAEAGTYAKFGGAALVVFVVAIPCTEISGAIFGIVAALAALTCLGCFGCVVEAFTAPKKMTSAEGVKSHIEKCVMKTPRVVQELRSVFDSTDLSQIRFPFGFLAPPKKENDQLFLIVADPWEACSFSDDWYSQYESPWGYNEKGEPRRFGEIVVRNARFGCSSGPSCVVQVPRDET